MLPIRVYSFTHNEKIPTKQLSYALSRNHDLIRKEGFFVDNRSLELKGSDLKEVGEEAAIKKIEDALRPEVKNLSQNGLIILETDFNIGNSMFNRHSILKLQERLRIMMHSKNPPIPILMVMIGAGESSKDDKPLPFNVNELKLKESEAWNTPGKFVYYGNIPQLIKILKNFIMENSPTIHAEKIVKKRKTNEKRGKETGETIRTGNPEELKRKHPVQTSTQNISSSLSSSILSSSSASSSVSTLLSNSSNSSRGSFSSVFPSTSSLISSSSGSLSSLPASANPPHSNPLPQTVVSAKKQKEENKSDSSNRPKI